LNKNEHKIRYFVCWKCAHILRGGTSALLKYKQRKLNVQEMSNNAVDYTKLGLNVQRVSKNAED
jgi:hypothetical protein